MNAFHASIEIRIVLAVILALAGALKFNRNAAEHREILRFAGITSTAVARFLVGLLPFTELGLSLWLISNWHPVVSLLLTSMLLFVFVVISLLALKKGYKSGCGCFGSMSSSGQLGGVHIAYTGVLTGSAILVLMSEISRDGPALSLLNMRGIDWLASAVMFLLLHGIYLMAGEIANVSRISSQQRT